MRKSVLIVFLIVLAFQLVKAQYQFEYGNRVAKTGINVVDYQVVGTQQYYLFEFTGTIDADPRNTTISLTKTNGNGLTVAYAIVILDEGGSYVRSIQFESISNTRKPVMAINSTGEIFILAPVISGIAFDPANLSNISHTATGHAIAKYAANGQLLYSKSGSFRAPSSSTDYHIAQKSDGGFALGMTTSGINDMDFDQGTTTNVGNNTGLRYFFLGNYDQNATLQSHISAPLSSSQSANIQAMETDADDAIYLYGHTRASVDLDPSTTGSFDIGGTSRDNNYLVKYESSLTLDWGLNLGAGNIAGNRKMNVRTGRVVIGGRTPWEGLYGDSGSGDRDRLDLDPADPNNTVDAVTQVSAGIFLAEYQSSNGSFVTGKSYGGNDGVNETLYAITSSGIDLVITANLSENTSWSSNLHTSTISSGNHVINLLGGFHHMNAVETFGSNITLKKAYLTTNKLLINASLSTAEDIDSGSGTVTYTPIAGTEHLNIGMDKGTHLISSNQTDLCFGESIAVSGFVYDSPGTYRNYYTTAADEDSISVTVIGSVIPEITAQTIVQNATNGLNSGEITVTASGGTGSFEYSLDGGPFSTNNTFSNLSVGNYSIQVKSSGTNTDCFKSISTTVSGAAPVINITKEIKCFGETADITVNATHGTPPYSYSIDNVNFQASPDFSGLTAMNYVVIARDANGADAFDILVLTEPDELEITNIFPTDVTCFGGNDGSLAAAVNGGTQSYSYSLDGINFQSSPIFNNLAIGSYIYYVKDANGCIVSATAAVSTQATEITAFYSATAASACGSSDGGFTITNTAGGAGNYEYMITGGVFQTSPAFNNLAAGLYEVTIKDDNDCTTQITVPVSEPSGITADVNFLDPTCYGSTDGQITVDNVTGGSGTYSYSINGTDFQQSNVFTGLGAGSVNVVIKDDQGCTAIKTVFLIEPPELQLSGTIDTHVSCKDGNDASVTLTASGGTPLYQYSTDGVSYVNLTNQPEVLTGLSAGLNTLFVRDLNGCVSTVDLTITEPVGSTISIDYDTDLTCFGDSDAAITIVASSPVPGALEFSLDGTAFTSSGSFTDLSAGDYTAFVKDSNNCIQEYDFSIDQPDQITASLGITDLTCHGSADGSISVTAMGGTGSLSYSLDGTNYQPLDTFQNLAAGSYTVTVKDDNDCSITLSATVSEPTQLFLSISSFFDPSCNGGSDGTFTLSESGGTGPYEYSIDGTTFQASPTFSGLAAGTYNFIIRDSNGCTNTSIGQLADPSVLTAAVVVNNQVSCFGQADGSATITASGGNTGYSYSLDGMNFDNTSGTFDALSAGSYSIVTKDARGCTTTTMFTITEPVELTTSATVDHHVTCNAGSDGTVSANASGGTAPYMYSIDGLNFQNSATFSGLSAGNITLTVKDANDCSASTTVQLTEPTAISAQLSVTEVTCHEDMDGAIVVTAAGGAGNYEFSIDGINFSTSGSFNNLGAGNYTIMVRDDVGCTATVTGNVEEPDAINLNFETVDITCNGAGDGQVAGFAQGGTSPYQYSLDGTNFQNSAFDNLGAGSYTLTVKDSQGCTASKTVNINEPTELMVSGTVISQISCHNADDGVANVTVTGGSAPYSYSLDGTSFNGSIDLSALAPASYTVTVRDANNCEANTSFVITEPDPLTVSSEISTVLCNGGSDGGITASATGGTAPFTYSIDGINFGNSDKFTDLMAGTYTITVKDSQGCIATTSASVTEPDAITATASTTSPLCHGDANGEITVTSSGGSGTLEYALDGTSFQTNSTFTGLVAGSYTVTIRDANACTDNINVTVMEPTALAVSPSVVDALCFGESNGELSVTASGGTGTLEYSLDGTTFQSATTFTGLAAGEYTVTVKDAKGCTITTSASIGEPTELNVTATVVSDNSINVTASGGTGPYEYSIDGTSFQSASSFTDLPNGNYTITVRDSNGCTTATSGSLIVTSLEEAPDVKSIQVFPNPVSDYLTFSRLESGDQIRLISLDGNSLDHVIITEAKDELRKDISGIRQKVFLAIVVSKDGRIKLNQKVMKEE